MQHKNSEPFVTDIGRLFPSELPSNGTEFIPQWVDRAGGKMQIFPFLKL